MKRPTISPEMIRQAAEKLSLKLVWVLDDEKDAFASFVAEHWHYGMDAFDLGKQLDRDGWHIDSGCIDDLEQMDAYVRQLLVEAEKAWAAWENPQPPLPIGAMTTKGEITGIDEHGVARYLVKPAGQDDSRGWSRLVVKFEDAVAV